MYEPPTTNASVDPIISRLRPRTVAEILDQAFRLYRRHFLTFVAIIAVVYVPLQLVIQGSTAFLLGGLMSDLNDLDNFSGGSSSQVNELFSYLGVLYAVIIGFSLLSGLLQKLSEGALTAGVTDSYLDRPVSFGSSYRRMFSQAGPLIGLILLQILISVGILLPAIFVLFLAALTATGSNSGASGLIFCFACILFIPVVVGLVYTSVRLVITTPALIVERLGPVQAVRRSWQLVQNFWWRTFALVAVVGILGWVIQVGPSQLVSALVGIMAPRDFVLQQLITGLVSTLTSLFFLPLQLIAITMYYFDLRTRKEGYDLDTALSQRYPSTDPANWGGTYGGYGGAYAPGSQGFAPGGQPLPPSSYAPPELGVSGGEPTRYTPPPLTPEPPPAQGYYGGYTPPPADESNPETPQRDEPQG